MSLSHTPLNSDQIIGLLKTLGHPVKFVPYEELSEMTDLSQLLPASLILYQLGPVGHFVCVFQNQELGEDTVQFFDPLGYLPDQPLEKALPAEYRYRYHQNWTYLLELLSQADRIVYNEHRLQTRGTSTCGHWCTIRLLLSNLTNAQFFQLWKRKPKRDEVVARIYQSLLEEFSPRLSKRIVSKRR
jgi:hypothetical protein